MGKQYCNCVNDAANCGFGGFDYERAISGEKVSLVNFDTCMMLSVAYAASIGGTETLGTPPNVVLEGYAENMLGIKISFGHFMLMGVVADADYVRVLLFYIGKKDVPQSYRQGGIAGRGNQFTVVRFGQMDKTRKNYCGNFLDLWQRCGYFVSL